jgi:hypothetical protein
VDNLLHASVEELLDLILSVTPQLVLFFATHRAAIESIKHETPAFVTAEI